VRLLRYADEELLRRIERHESANRAEDTIAVHSGGNVYRIQRFCPHAKSDLFDCGEVLPGGIVRCLAHRYEYSLATGACLNGPGGRMRVERYGREQSSATPLLSMMERSS
jgi:UDP-MurNAc hydroxylase